MKHYKSRYKPMQTKVKEMSNNNIFTKAYSDLHNVYRHLFDVEGLSTPELEYREEFLKLCKQIVKEVDR